MLKLCVTAFALVALHTTAARAEAGCFGVTGWAPRTDQPIPPRAHLVFYTERPTSARTTAPVVATIDGKLVSTKVITKISKPYLFTDIEIESDKPGALEVGFTIDKKLENVVKYTVDATLTPPTKVSAKISRYFHEVPHSTVREVYDGLLLTLDVPVTAVTAIWHKGTVSESTLLPAMLEDRRVVVKLGELGCHANFSVAMLENGADLSFIATLADGGLLVVGGLDEHVTLPARPKPEDGDDKPVAKKKR